MHSNEFMKPVWESAVIVASHYAKACGRDVMVGKDVAMGLMFAARRVLGVVTTSMYPDIYEAEDSDEDKDSDRDEADEWTRYTGDDAHMLEVNHLADTWHEWQPQSPAERALKAAVDSVCKTHGFITC